MNLGGARSGSLGLDPESGEANINDGQLPAKEQRRVHFRSMCGPRFLGSHENLRSSNNCTPTTIACRGDGEEKIDKTIYKKEGVLRGNYHVQGMQRWPSHRSQSPESICP